MTNLSLLFFLAASWCLSASILEAAEFREINVTKAAAFFAEAAKVIRIVIIDSFILLVLIDPLRIPSACLHCHSSGGDKTYLVEIRLQKVNLFVGLQKARPELIFGLLLPQDQLNLTVVVVHLGVFGVNLVVKIQRHVVGHTLLGRTGKCDIGRGDLKI